MTSCKKGIFKKRLCIYTYIMRWIVNNKHYDTQRLDRPTPEACRRYYQGFNYRKPMYNDELRDLATVYNDTIDDLEMQIDASLPALLYYLEEFLSLHKKNKAVHEKLETLLAKTGRQSQEESDGRDYE